MKALRNTILMVAMAFISTSSFGQKGKIVLNTNDVPKVTHVHLDDFPKDEVLPMIEGWGGMTVDINRAPAGTDFKPLLEGLENDHCQVPHWGYMVKGAIQINYEDGTEELFKEGEAFYMKPGHTAVVINDLLLVSFGPKEGMQELVDHLKVRVAELQKNQAAK